MRGRGGEGQGQGGKRGRDGWGEWRRARKRGGEGATKRGRLGAGRGGRRGRQGERERREVERGDRVRGMGPVEQSGRESHEGRQSGNAFFHNEPGPESRTKDGNEWQLEEGPAASTASLR